MGPGTRLRASRPLSGGIAQATDALTIDDRTGRRHRLVLQRWLRPETDGDPGFTPGKEAAVLETMATTTVPVPRVVAVDPDGPRPAFRRSSRIVCPAARRRTLPAPVLRC